MLSDAFNAYPHPYVYLFLKFEVYIRSDTFHKPYSYDRHIVYVVNCGIAGITASAVSIGVVLSLSIAIVKYKEIDSTDMKPYQSPTSHITHKLRTFFNRSKPRFELLGHTTSSRVQQDLTPVSS